MWFTCFCACIFMTLALCEVWLDRSIHNVLVIQMERFKLMMSEDVKAVQRQLVKDSFADKMAALKKQESEFSDLVSDLFALRALHDSLQDKMNAYKDMYLNKSKAQLVSETGVTTAELRYIMSAPTTFTPQGENTEQSDSLMAGE